MIKSRSIRRVTALLLTLLLSFGITVPALAATNTRKVPTEITYHQTEARKLLGLINNYRTSKDAWCYNPSNPTQKITVNTVTHKAKAYTYDYTLEKIAMNRLAEMLYSTDGKRPNHQDPANYSINGVKTTWEYGDLGHKTAQATFTALKGKDDSYKNQPYRAMLLTDEITCIGAAYGTYTYSGKTYEIWVVEFGKTNSGAQATQAVNGKKTVQVDVANDIATPNDTYEFKQSGDNVVLYRNGKQYTDFTGFVPIQSGNRVVYGYIKNGVMQKGTNGIVKGMVGTTNGQWKVKDGVVDSGFTGPYKVNGNSYNVVKGQVK